MPSQTPPNLAAHLVIPFAAAAGDEWLAALRALPPGRLKNTGKLLQGMKQQATDNGELLSLTPPHERVEAKALGLTGADGLRPFAALQARDLPGAAGQGWAHVTLCHWAMGREHATLADPAALAVTPEESATLIAAMQPYFITEGITLHDVAPGRWLAEGDALRTLPTASLDRVMGRNVDTWLPDTTTAGSLRRLQNEMQMLLYTHPLNDARAAKRQWAINSFWMSGTGALPGVLPPAEPLTVVRTLAQAAFNDDWQAYAEAWTALDAGPIAALLARQNAGETVRLSLCGERHAQTFVSSKAGFAARVTALFSTPNVLDVLVQL